MRRIVVCLAATLACAPAALADGPPAKTAFEQLKALAGDWRTTDEANPTAVQFKTIANGSTLIETWTMAPTRQSMTVYTMDGDDLLATHYCPQGNAPRLRFTHTGDDGAHHFLFLDGANLQDASRSHAHVLWINDTGAGKLERGETYIANGSGYTPGEHGVDRYTFVRVAP